MRQKLTSSDDILAYIYIIETGVPEPTLGGRSPLYEDVFRRLTLRSLTESLDDLLFDGAVERSKFYNLLTLTTTDDGHRRATDIVHARVDECVDTFESISSSIPLRLHGFLFSQPESDKPKLDEVGNWCVLSDPRVEVWKQIQQTAEDTGLAFSTRSYVSTRGGEIRETRDVVAGEIIDLCRDSPPTGKSGNMPEEFDVNHRLYHLLSPPFEWTSANYFRLPGLREKSQELRIPMSRVQEEVASLVDTRLLRRERVDMYFCDDPPLLLNAIGQKYLSPLVDWLVLND